MPDWHDYLDADNDRVQARWRGLGRPDGMLFYEVRCANVESAWRAARSTGAFTINLARSGGYLRRLNGHERFADPTSALLTGPADDLVVSHPLTCGDTYTAIEIESAVLAERSDGERWLTGAGWDGRVSDRLDLAHRTLITDCVRGVDSFALTERLHRLLDGLLATGASDGATDRPDDELSRTVGRRPATLAAHRRLVNRTREVITGGGHTLGLTELARQVNCSPHHLSRVFHRVTGQSLTTYRTQIRTRAVLTALAGDDLDTLRTLAAEHGFADQPHLTRTLRRQLGHSPAQLRKLLATAS